MNRDKAGLRLTNVSKSFGSVRVLDALSLEVREGEFVALLGPSGCGKTTLLNLIAGFFPPDSGCIEIGGIDVTGVPAYRRDTAMVFQDYALFPHLDVLRNVSFGLRMRRGLARGEIKRRVHSALALVKMAGMEDRYPHQLSGGQRQRVALARALVVEPAVLLLDEPLSNLDANLREDMRLELRQLQRTLGIPTVHVTHDQEEAFAVADRVAVLLAGRVEQLGTPMEIYRAPATAAVADFVGRANWLSGRITEAGVFIAELGSGVSATVRVIPAADPGTVGYLLVRPEHVVLSPEPMHAECELRGKLEARVYLGHITQYYVRAGSTVILGYEAAELDAPLQEGDVVFVRWPRKHARFLPSPDT